MADVDIDIMLAGELPPPTAVPVTGVSASSVIYSRQCFLMGWCLSNSSTANAETIVLFDGLDSTGVRAGNLDIAISSSSTVWLAGCGLYLQSGLYVASVGGTISGAFYIRKI